LKFKKGDFMQGSPKILQTREDFDAILALALAGNADSILLAGQFTGLLESASSFVFDRALTATELPDGVLPNFCVTEATTEDPVRRQHKMIIDPAARLFSLGYSVLEIQSIILSLGVK
jgi:hypothetical protein